ncbi:HAD family hydrolase [Arthrobacter sp. GMC3]|uniref:HAD family hydrolase n=1 Tax=Arthrobacter sp. GMC3 TaxID=2058894 RepID=UPI000CE2E672|nr:HAD family hydrolase [Arthrobacter sp. GMC3]
METDATQSTPGPPPSKGRVGGVLFDIDETLVDLYQAMRDAMEVAGRDLLPANTAQDWDLFAAIYMADTHNYYDRYVAGEFTFAQQRGLRARVVFDQLGTADFDEVREQRWIEDFEVAQPLSIRAFEDVVPILDALDAAGIPYGCVSNNVYDYQRAKLDQAGLARIQVLVGIDTLDAAKPAPQVFLEGCRQLGTRPAQTLYVGDNYLIDAVGSARAGLRGVWLNREDALAPSNPEGSTEGLDEITEITNLFELGLLLALEPLEVRL